MHADNQQKTKTQQFIERFISSEELAGISQSISNAYSAVEEVYKATPALGAFMVGADLRPHLLRVFVEHSLQKFADNNKDFNHEIRPNAARNCWHLNVYKQGLALTTHYMGANCERTEGRKAIYKTNLSERNGDLFAFEKDEIDIFDKIGYGQIMHGGIAIPENILINIPSRDQSHSIGSMTLEIVKANKIQVEEIIEERPFKLPESIEIQNGNKKAG